MEIKLLYKVNIRIKRNNEQKNSKRSAWHIVSPQLIIAAIAVAHFEELCLKP